MLGTAGEIKMNFLVMDYHMDASVYLVVFYGTSNIVGYLIPNPVFTNIYDL